MVNNCNPDFKEESKKNQKALTFALLLILLFAFIEAGVGWMSGSLALISDAGHMFTDSIALFVAWIAGYFMNKPPSKSHSYGFARIEVLAALLNALFMLVVIISIVYESIDRLFNYTEVKGNWVLIVASLGLLINLFVAYILSNSMHGHGHSNLNTRSAMLHVMGDLFGSVVAILSGLVICLTGWMPIDPILSIVICFIIIRSVYQLLQETFLVLMEGVPDHIDLYEVKSFLLSIDNITQVSDLHIWNLSTGYVALTAHIKLDNNNFSNWQSILNNINNGLSSKFGIKHVTVQPELN